jgi:hypothetical protein
MATWIVAKEGPMLPLVVALTLSPWSPPPALPPTPKLAPELQALVQSCPDLDPHFVVHVAPPSGAGPLWVISDGPPPLPRRPDVGGLTGADASVAPPRLGCVRLVPVGR